MMNPEAIRLVLEDIDYDISKSLKYRQHALDFMSGITDESIGLGDLTIRLSNVIDTLYKCKEVIEYYTTEDHHESSNTSESE